MYDVQLLTEQQVQEPENKSPGLIYDIKEMQKCIETAESCAWLFSKLFFEGINNV